MAAMSELIDQLALLIDRGGNVMFPLLGLSVIGLGLVFERMWFWLSITRSARVAAVTRLTDALRRGDRAMVLSVTGSRQTPFGVVARRLVELGATDSVAIESVEEQRPRLERFMVALSTIITAAPLLGILGTVIGIIRSFNLLGSQETLTDPRVVSAGIAEALLTTALGLVVALVTLFPYMAFRKQVDRALGRMESIVAAAQQGFGPTAAGSVVEGVSARPGAAREESGLAAGSAGRAQSAARSSTVADSDDSNADPAASVASDAR